jgi:DNA-binding GntR family transcriptional regulator
MITRPDVHKGYQERTLSGSEQSDIGVGNSGIVRLVSNARAKRTQSAPTADPLKPRSEPRQRAKLRHSRVDVAYAEIRRRILDNRYAPGQQVLEQELALDLGMSRTPVREALVKLQNERFVQLIPRHGMRVVPLSMQDLREVYEVLTTLELTAIERLAKADLDDGAFADVDNALDEMDLAIKKKDADAWAKADERFHRTVVTLSGNSRLAAMVEMLWEQSHRARMTTVQLRASLEQSNREHRAVVEAIRRRDWQQARTRHAKHRARATAEILKLLQQTRLGSF